MLFYKVPFIITTICIFIPIIQVLIEFNLNRIVLITSIFILFFSIRKIHILNFYTIFTIIVISFFIIYGIIQGKGFIYSANSAPLIFGIIFYYYFIISKNFDENYYRNNLSLIYKFLIIFMFIELLISNYDHTILYNAFKSDEVYGYRKLSHKLNSLIDLNIRGLNSLYLGPQISSIIAVSSIVFFYPYNKMNFSKYDMYWFVSSLFIFILNFSLTSLIMFFAWILLKIIYIRGNRIFIIFTLIATFPIAIFLYLFFTIKTEVSSNYYEFYVNSSNYYEFYFNNFYEIFFAFFNLPLEYQLYGIPWNETIIKYTKSFEFGYFIRLMELGLYYNLFIICLNILILIYVYIYKNRFSTFIKINMITLTIWHISLIHYHPALKTGPAQLFGLYIGILLFFIRYKSYSIKLINHNGKYRNHEEPLV